MLMIVIVQVKIDDLADQVVALQEQVRAARNEASTLRVELAVAKAEALIPTAVSIGDSNTRCSVFSVYDFCNIYKPVTHDDVTL